MVTFGEGEGKKVGSLDDDAMLYYALLCFAMLCFAVPRPYLWVRVGVRGTPCRLRREANFLTPCGFFAVLHLGGEAFCVDFALIFDASLSEFASFLSEFASFLSEFAPFLLEFASFLSEFAPLLPWFRTEVFVGRGRYEFRLALAFGYRPLRCHAA